MKPRKFLSASTLLLMVPLCSCVGGAQAGSAVSPPSASASVAGSPPEADPPAQPAAAGAQAPVWSDLAPVEPPIQVVRVYGSQIYINRGEYSGVLPHATYSLFALGEMLTDPISGMKLGPAETFLGRVHVVRIAPRYAIVEPIGHLSGAARMGNVLYADGLPVPGQSRPRPKPASNPTSPSGK